LLESVIRGRYATSPKIPVWVFVGADDYMRKEQQETVTSARRFGVEVVETIWPNANHGGIFKHARAHQPMLDWLVGDEDLRNSAVK
jgi:acetyl esterase/lipase